MERTEIIIGREVEKGDYTVDAKHTAVGRKHARMFRKNDGMYIEDLNSANGTFVNGKSVKLKKITDADSVMLGGKDYYKLNLAKAWKMIPMLEREFQEKTQNLKRVYDTYQKNKVKIQSESQGSMMLKRTMPMVIPGLLTMILSFTMDFEENPHLSMFLKIIGGAGTAIAVLIGGIWASSSLAKTPERLNNLQQEFMKEYVCPNCKQYFGEQPWENIHALGKCRACGREFK